LDFAALRVGHVVYAQIPDPAGAPLNEPHPAMVLRAPDADGTLWLLGISTKYSVPVGRLMIELPWSPGGHPATGLSRPCVLKCWWAVRWNANHVIRRLGALPPDIVEQAIEYAITAIQERKAQSKGNG